MGSKEDDSGDFAPETTDVRRRRGGMQMSVEARLDSIDKKLDSLLTLEGRVQVLESHAARHDGGITELKANTALRIDIAKLEGRVEAGEKAAAQDRLDLARKEGRMEGVRLVWLAVAGTPGVIAMAIVGWFLARMGGGGGSP